MQFAFSTLACPEWDLPAIAARAREYGYDGVEMRIIGHETAPTAAEALRNPEKVRNTFDAAGVPMSCLSTDIALAGNRSRHAAAADELRRCIDAAAAMGCGRVSILDPLVSAGQNSAEAGAMFAKWITALADHAADRDVMILVENAGSYRRAHEMWMLMELVNHPAVGVSWDALSAAFAGESPALSVPTLNQRIGYVHMGDAEIGQGTATPAKLGEGSVKIRLLLNRLRGIGYKGWVSYQWDRASIPKLAPAEQILPDAIQKLRLWTRPPEPPAGPKKEVKKAVAAPAAAASPK